MISNRRILFVSNERPDESTRRTLETRGFELTLAKGFEDASQRLGRSEIMSVIVDVDRTPGAIAFIKHLRETETTRAIPILVLGEWGTGQPSLALSHGADAYERTPVDAERLTTSIERMLAEPRFIGAAAGGKE